MRIAVVGTGYVGLISGVCFAEVGHDVTCIDIDECKINKLQKGEPTIYEEGLEELLVKNLASRRLRFTTDFHTGLEDQNVIIIAVGTPSLESGRADLQYVEDAAIKIAHNISEYTVIVTKSTVPVGTNESIRKIIADHLLSACEFDVVSAPEFLREGTAIQDTFNSERTIIGSENKRSANVVEQMYEPMKIPIMHTDIRSAEMIKYASNAFLSTKISFINEIANICEKVGANIESVASGMGMDSRIGPKFLQAGIGYGGSCFPKDTKALVQIAGNVDHEFDLLQSVISVNNKQQNKLIDKASLYYGKELRGKRAAILGLAYKPNTSDIRDAASIKIIQKLLQQECEIRVYDPAAMSNFQNQYPDFNIAYTASYQEAIKDADFIMIVTEWNQFKQMDLLEVKQLLREPVIFDGRNCLPIDQLQQAGFNYFSIGRPDIIAKQGL